MKKFTKVCLTLVLIFVVLGMVFAVIGMALGFRLEDINRISNIGGESTEEYEFSVDGIKNLDIEIDAGILEMATSHDDKIKVLVEGNSNSWKCYQDGERLIILDELEHSFWTIFGNNGTHVTLYLPENYEVKEGKIVLGAGEANIEKLTGQEVSMEVGAGTLHGNKIQAEEKLNLTAGAGEIEINEMEAGDTYAECGIGSISLEGKIQGNVTAECGVGEISFDIKGEEDDYNYYIESGVGNITIDENEYDSIGTDKKIDNGANKTFNLECGVGSIEINIED